MAPDTHFRVNAPTVTHETIEGESVIINLESGNYYSLPGSGAEIWVLISRNASSREIVEHLAQRYKGNRGPIEESVEQLLLELESEQLIVREEPGAGTKFDLLPTAVEEDGAEFQPPELQKFTDMQELLLLDPIHEVDAAGWPTAKQDA